MRVSRLTCNSTHLFGCFANRRFQFLQRASLSIHSRLQLLHLSLQLLNLPPQAVIVGAAKIITIKAIRISVPQPRLTDWLRWFSLTEPTSSEDSSVIP